MHDSLRSLVPGLRLSRDSAWIQVFASYDHKGYEAEMSRQIFKVYLSGTG